MLYQLVWFHQSVQVCRTIWRRWGFCFALLRCCQRIWDMIFGTHVDKSSRVLLGLPIGFLLLREMWTWNLEYNHKRKFLWMPWHNGGLRRFKGGGNTSAIPEIMKLGVVRCLVKWNLIWLHKNWSGNYARSFWRCSELSKPSKVRAQTRSNKNKQFRQVANKSPTWGPSAKSMDVHAHAISQEMHGYPSIHPSLLNWPIETCKITMENSENHWTLCLFMNCGLRDNFWRCFTSFQHRLDKIPHWFECRPTPSA